MKGFKNCHSNLAICMSVQQGFPAAEFLQVSLRVELWKLNEFMKVLRKLESFLECFCQHICIHNNEMDLIVFLFLIVETITICFYKLTVDLNDFESFKMSTVKFLTVWKTRQFQTGNIFI